MFFVDDRELYGQADEARFWELGERAASARRAQPRCA
jgi:hypothetical protein